MSPRRVLRRGKRPQRRRLFVGCEGESERGYAALLQRFVDQEGRSVHLDAVLLQPGGGDPCALIELAIARRREKEARYGDRYADAFVLLDTDKLGISLQRDVKGKQLAQENSLTLVWQCPCHEALLLRHLENCTNLRPPTSALALQQLIRRWPEYQKGLAAMRLAERVDLAGARRVAQNDQAVAGLLTAAGLS